MATEASSTASGSPSKPAKAPRKPQPAGVKLYLAFYNAVQFLGWGYGLVLALQYLATSKQPTNFRLLWEHCSTVIATFQTLQFMEVIHAALRFVPSSPVQTFIQILSRLVLVWGVLVPVVEARSSLGVPMLLIAWSIAECTRYFYYGFHLYDAVPFFSTWLRYSLFIVLYPVGVTGELLTTYASLSTISKRKLWSIELPNPLNISFYYDYLLILFMLSYIHFFPQLFFFMLAQRKKFLGSGASSHHPHSSWMAAEGEVPSNQAEEEEEEVPQAFSPLSTLPHIVVWRVYKKQNISEEND